MSLEDRVSGIIMEQLGVTKDELAPEANNGLATGMAGWSA